MAQGAQSARWTRTIISILVIAGLAVGLLGHVPGSAPGITPVYAAGPAQADPVAPAGRSAGDRYTFEECSRADAEQVQAEMQAIAGVVLGDATGALDYQALVDRKWAELDTGAVFDRAVESAVQQVKAEQPYWDRLWSGWSAAKAGEFAEQTATYAFDSPQFAQALDALSAAIAVGLVAELEAMTARSASSALLCLQAYVGDAYSHTLFDLFQQEIGTFVSVEGLEVPVNPDVSPVEMHTKALGGAGIIVATQVTRRIAQSLSQKMAGRLAGKVASRVLGRIGSTVIPYVGWIAGIALIAWDLWEGAEGALPQIRESLQAEEVKVAIRTEIAAELEEQLTGEASTLAATLAGTLVHAWEAFCREHVNLCSLTAALPPFRTLLDTTPLTGIDRLTRLADALMETTGIAGLEAALDAGEFEQLLAAPDPVLAILTWSASPQTALAWAEASAATEQPDALDRVVQSEIYKTVAPGTLSAKQLATIVTIDDNLVINKLVRLEPSVLESLLNRLPSIHLAVIVADASDRELAWLAGYLMTQDADGIERAAQRLALGEVSIEALRVESQLIATEAGLPAALLVAESGPEPLASSGETPANVPVALAWLGLLQTNGVLAAALLLFMVLIGIGVLFAVRQKSS